MKKLSKSIQEKINKTNKIQDVFDDSFEQLCYKNDIYVSCYLNDTAIYWMNGDFIPEILKDNYLYEHLLFLNNTWLYIIPFKWNNYYIIFWIPIKKEYPFENRYLENYYYKKFRVNTNLQFKDIPETAAYYIYDQKHNYLFSVIPTQEKLYSKTFSELLFSLFVIFYVFTYILVINKNKYAIIPLLTLLIVQIIRTFFNIPSVLNTISLFNTETFAAVGVFKYLGDVFFYTLLMLIFIEKWILQVRKKLVRIFWLRWLLLIFGIISFVILIKLINDIVFQSNISLYFHKTSEWTLDTIIAYLILILWSWIWLRFVWLFSRIFVRNTNQLYKITFIEVVALGLTQIVLLNWFTYGLLWIIPLLILLFINFSLVRKTYKYLGVFIVVFVQAAFVINYTYQLIERKNKEIQKTVAITLANERDYIAQMLLQDMEYKLKNDKRFSLLVQKTYDNRYEIYKYLKDKYFLGYWNGYDIQVTVCNSYDNLRIIPSNTLCKCFDYFDNIYKHKGEKLTTSMFYVIETENGDPAFLGIYRKPIMFFNDTIEKRVFIEIYRKVLYSIPGYPDILIDKVTHKALSNLRFEYAKYRNNRLINQNGNYDYPYYFSFSTKEQYFEKNGYVHYLYIEAPSRQIIVSFPKVSFLDSLLSILFLLNLFILIFVVPYILYQYISNQKKRLYGFRYKFIISFVSIILISYIVIAFYSILYFNYQFKQKNLLYLNDKRQAIVGVLAEYIGSFSSIDSLSSELLNKKLITLSNNFHLDINIYDLKGFLKATSRPAFFDKEIKNKLLPFKVKSILSENKNKFYINEENIGKLNYLSYYQNLYSDGKVHGILQIPYFTEIEKMQKDRKAILLNLTNIYILFIAIAFLIFLYITRGIFKPLDLLRKYFRNIRPKENIELIEYTGEDEIAPLVREYNRVLQELAATTKKIIESERESTWRDIAKQIAHEIKNPLTPMKLNIQYLLKLKKENKELPEGVLENTFKSILEQIDNLSAISFAFSSFANLPALNLDKIEIISLISSLLPLFKQENFEVKTYFNNIKECYILADKDYLTRILTNIINNAIQAVPPDRDKDIVLQCQIKKDKLIISVKDNGIGIDEQLAPMIFKPNFTTKSSGMGLGLSIVKTMVDALKGNIYFTSVPGDTVFYIEFSYVEVRYE